MICGDDITAVNDSDCIEDERVEVVGEILLTNSRRSEVHEGDLRRRNDLKESEDGQGCYRTTTRVTSHEEL